jgi:hypothetical protein
MARGYGNLLFGKVYKTTLKKHNISFNKENKGEISSWKIRRGKYIFLDF